MTGTYETKEDAGTKPDDQVQFWLGELKLADDREKDWLETAERVVKIYEAEEKEEFQFNILFSNTETMAPALYNATPRPVVRRRFKDADPVGALAAQTGRRMLEFLQDTNLNPQTSFDNMVGQVVLDALVPGRGVAWFEVGDDGLTAPAVVPWERFRHGYGRQWEDVAWVSRDHYMTREELTANFGELGNKVPVSDAKGNTEDRRAPSKNQGALKTARVTELWCKADRKVRFVAASFPDAFLREVDDPIKLSGFFPCPKPLTFIRKISGLVPVAPYELYEEQAKELNRITLRINKIIGHLKVRGLYDSTVEGLDKVMDLDDGQLAAVDNIPALKGGQGKVEEALWLVPLEKLVSVLQQLYTQRTQIKQVIYEVTGIADILRGSSVASETATAQEIKNQWGTLRLKRAQRIVQAFVRDVLRMWLELQSSLASEEWLAKAVGLPLMTSGQKAQATQMLAAMQVTGQQPSQELVMQVQMPTWAEVLAVLQDDQQRAFKVDIETNSTVDLEATEDQKLIAEFLTAMGQYMSGIGPLVERGVMPFEAAQSMMLAISRRFRFGDEVEEQLKRMKPPQKENPDAGKLQQAQAETQAAQAALAQQQKEHVDEMAMERMRMDTEFKSRALEQRDEMMAQMEKVRSDFSIAKFEARVKQQTELQKAAIEAATQIELARINAATVREDPGVEPPVAPGNEQIMTAILDTQKRLLELAAAPKVGTLSNGKQIRIETQVGG